LTLSSIFCLLHTKGVPGDDSEKIGTMLKPNASASGIANTCPEKYDVFAQVCGPGSYLPNSRLQQLLEAPVLDELVIEFKCELVRSLAFVDTFRKVAGGSETLIVDPNLQRMLSIMAAYSDKSLTSTKVTIPESNLYLANAAGPEIGLFAKNGPNGPAFMVGTEAKGIEASVRQCYPQLITVCGNSCLELNRIGLSYEDCVVPGIAMAGASCQFLAMYLLSDSFPVLAALSPLLSPFGTWDEQKEVAKWCLRLVAFARQTAETTLHCQLTRSPTQMEVRLNLHGYFAKPIRNGFKFRMEETFESDETLIYSDKSIRLNEIMRIYEQLRVSGLCNDIDMGKLLLFPEGVVSVPGEDVRETKQLRGVLVQECEVNEFSGMDLNFRPLILFPRLSRDDGWTNDKPARGLQQQRYLGQLELAIAALNTAKIAHLDLRPANILWREAQNDDVHSVELRLIDFEDAVPFGQVIPPGFVQIIVSRADRRYPFKGGDEQSRQIARDFHNKFFLEAIRQWTSSEENKFGDFMNEEGKGSEILHSLLAP
jgi:hypothetical protein